MELLLPLSAPPSIVCTFGYIGVSLHWMAYSFSMAGGSELTLGAAAHCGRTWHHRHNLPHQYQPGPGSISRINFSSVLRCSRSKNEQIFSSFYESEGICLEPPVYLMPVTAILHSLRFLIFPLASSSFYMAFSCMCLFRISPLCVSDKPVTLGLGGRTPEWRMLHLNLASVSKQDPSLRQYIRLHMWPEHNSTLNRGFLNKNFTFSEFLDSRSPKSRHAPSTILGKTLNFSLYLQAQT